MSNEAIREIVRKLSEIPSHDRLFNPYRDRLDIDNDQAPGTRRQNIRRYLEALSRETPRQVWVFEAPRRGAVRTGVPQTSEAQLIETSRRLGVAPPFQRATRADVSLGQPSSTSQIVWSLLKGKQIPVLWNACMGLPWRNRNLEDVGSPRSSDVRCYAPVFVDIIKLFQPTRILWSGAKAIKLRDVVGPSISIGTEQRLCDHPKRRGGSNFVQVASEMLAD